jgi:hypothetical protein
MMRTFTSETLALHAARYSDVSQDRFFRQGEYAEQQNARIAPLKAVAPTMRSTTLGWRLQLMLYCKAEATQVARRAKEMRAAETRAG